MIGLIPKHIIYSKSPDYVMNDLNSCAQSIIQNFSDTTLTTKHVTCFFAKNFLRTEEKKVFKKENHVHFTRFIRKWKNEYAKRDVCHTMLGFLLHFYILFQHTLLIFLALIIKVKFTFLRARLSQIINV